MRKVLLIITRIFKADGYPEDLFERMERVAEEGQNFQCKFDGATIAYGASINNEPNKLLSEYGFVSYVNQ